MQPGGAAFAGILQGEDGVVVGTSFTLSLPSIQSRLSQHKGHTRLSGMVNFGVICCN